MKIFWWYTAGIMTSLVYQIWHGKLTHQYRALVFHVYLHQISVAFSPVVRCKGNIHPFLVLRKHFSRFCKRPSCSLQSHLCVSFSLPFWRNKVASPYYPVPNQKITNWTRQDFFQSSQSLLSNYTYHPSPDWNKNKIRYFRINITLNNTIFKYYIIIWIFSYFTYGCIHRYLVGVKNCL